MLHAGPPIMGPVRLRRDRCKRVSRTTTLFFITIVACLFFLTRHVSRSGLPEFYLPDPGSQVQHPIRSLVNNAQAEFEATLARQSRTLEEAVAEYQRRHGFDPPPHFDKWYAYTQEHDIPLVDEYDGINELLKPFWGISPSAIRRNVKHALGGDKYLIAFFIRDGKLVATERGEEWKTGAIRSAVEPFAEYLPDMDLAFNSHDEARVVIPHDQLIQMVDRGQQAQLSHSTSQMQWSPRAADINSGKTENTSITAFLEYAHHFTWSVATLSCPPTSPARVSSYDGVQMADDLAAYDQLPLGFIRNRTAFTDVCLSPSLSERHGFFNMPNSWSVTHDPIPVFSPSKVSSFHDILYPAPWYLGNRVTYDEAKDRLWERKTNALYWRGSTTSGFSRGGVWHRQERQRFVEQVEKPGTGFVLEQQRRTGKWTTKEVSRDSYKDLFDVHFSHIGQCSEEDCEEQSKYFDVQPEDVYETNWKSRFLLDIDGNAFSGRFYTFLQSYSLTLKQAMFREWHENRVMPWVHYLPLGLNGTDHIEMMRYLTQDADGQKLAQEIAQISRKWAFGSLRQVDMHAWMFRLLLEYGRLVDDHRQELGFRLP